MFCIWIGFGVLAIAEGLQKLLKNQTAAAGVAGAVCLVVPGVMLANGWDNHDRSNRFHSVDQAKNTLRSCAPNAILFTGGDNDTFPLWYVQDVEGFRTDVRVVVLSYFSTDWYIEQMRRKVYESEPLPLTIEPDNYLQGKNDYIPLVESTERPLNIRTYIKLVNEDNPNVLVPLQGGDFTAKLPSKRFYLDIDRKAVLAKGFIPKDKENRIAEGMTWELMPNASYVFKNELALLDLIATNNWERPIYFNNTSANTLNMDLRDYLQLEGMTYRLMPIKVNDGGDVGEVNVEVMLENIKTFEFRGFEDPNVYHDEEYRKFGSNTRNSYFRLADELYQLNRDEEAKRVLDEALEKIPDHAIPYSFFTARFIELYHKLGEHEKADQIRELLTRRAKENLDYILRTERDKPDLRQVSLITLQQIALIYRRLERVSTMQLERLQTEVLINMEEGELEKRIEKARADQERYQKLAEEYNETFSETLDRLERYL